jgi:hypothetical protein
MLERLKSLPLTVLLTLLIWMYAESQSNPTHNQSIVLDRIPVLISGPPEVLSRYQINLENKTVRATLTGPQDQINIIRERLPGQSGVYAYLDVSSLDLPTVNDVFRTLRFVTPPNTTVAQPPQVGFRLVEKTGPANP